MKIAIVGAGYVGLSNALLLAQNHQVIVFDIIAEKIEQLNQGISPIEDKEIQQYLTMHKNNSTLNNTNQDEDNASGLTLKASLSATLDKELAIKNADFVIIATPTDLTPIITTLIQLRLKPLFMM